jgi:hypothetical protein
LSNPTTFTIFLPFSLKRHMPLKWHPMKVEKGRLNDTYHWWRS